MTCKFVGKDGRRCQAKALTSRTFCFFHNPEDETREERRRAQSLGGRGRRRTAVALPPLDFNFESPRKIARTMGELSELVYGGVISEKRADTIGRLSGHALRAIEAGTIAENVAQTKRMAEAERAAPIDFTTTFATEFEEADESEEYRKKVVALAERIKAHERAEADSDEPSGNPEDTDSSEGI